MPFPTPTPPLHSAHPVLDVSTVIPRTAPPPEVLRASLDALERGERVVVATVIARQGSAPCTPGQKLVLFQTGAAIGTVGGGAVERAVLVAMAASFDAPAPAPRVDTFRLGPSLGMCCGGSAEILIEPLSPDLSVLVVGAGHVGVYLAPLLASLGFGVTLCDAREIAADPARLPRPSAGPDGAGAPRLRLLQADHDDPEVRASLPADLGRSAALVMTHDHQLDQAAIEWALGVGFGFVGGVGSRAKAARTRARLETKGVAAADITRVRMPLGVDVGARLPAEIGVAIAAELVSWRAGLSGARRGARGHGHGEAEKEKEEDA
ncbi:XdhC family protein [Polyangium fumosum]|uniref:XdhC family protein n=1 Tax=Polyangium fumosum TaxID=889272 RepID=UPI001E3C5FB1|nr:XdhC family protein [Polyangium fumosum]